MQKEPCADFSKNGIISIKHCVNLLSKCWYFQVSTCWSTVSPEDLSKERSWGGFWRKKKRGRRKWRRRKRKKRRRWSRKKKKGTTFKWHFLNILFDIYQLQLFSWSRTINNIKLWLRLCIGNPTSKTICKYVFFLIFGDFIDKSNLICGFQLQTTSSVFFIKASKEYCSLSWSPALFIQIHSSFTRPGRKPNVLQNTVQHKYFQKGGNSIQKNLLGNNNCLNLAENRMVQEIQTMLNYETEKNTLDKYLK